jgi:hypothetical protein
MNFLLTAALKAVGLLGSEYIVHTSRGQHITMLELTY